LLNNTSDDRIELIARREAVLIGLAFVFLVLLAASLSLSTAARVGSWDGLGDRWTHWSVLPVWLMAYLLLRRGLNRVNPSRDPLLLPIPLLFIGWGLLTIWRLDPNFGIRQLGWFILATCSIYLLIVSPCDLHWNRRYRYLWITLGLGLMALTLLFGTHPGGGSPRLWLGCCGFYFQPSEGLRILLVAFLAAYLADRLPFQGLTRGSWDLRAWLPLFFIWLLSFGLLVVQRDLGTGMLFLALLTMLLYLVLDRWQVLVVAGLMALIGGSLGYFLFDVVAVRVEAWLNPWLDPLGGSYQIVQSLITVASGGLLGRGLGMGSPGFVPAIHTDFIFTAMIEEHGLLAGLALVALWVIWISRILSDVRKHREPFSALLSAGLGISLGLQAVLIIGGNLRLFPLVGVTLPFTSYGGSSLLVSCISLGILLLLSNGEAMSDRFQAPMQRLHTGMLLGWGAVALSLGWWTLIRAPALTARGDNPRWAIDSRYSKRGDILDRNGETLASTIGSIGSYERTYPSPQAASIVGYDLFPYGQTGIEDSQDELLRGLDRRDPWLVAWSYLTRGVSPAGSDVRLTLNQNLQKQAMDLLAQQRGAIVLIDADNGELLSAASSPSYDPNELEQTWSTLVADPGAPLLNRAIQGQYQPGSALAPFILAWAIDSEMIDLDLPVADMGQAVPVNGDVLTCAIAPEQLPNHTLRDALVYGCPLPIQTVLLELGQDAYEAVISSFGFNQPAEPDLQAKIGVGPIPETLDALGLAAIGQYELTMSPLQLARALAPLISEGELPTIVLVDAVRSEDGEWERFEDALASVSVISPKTAAELRSGLTIDKTFKYSAKAIAGEPLSWFLGGVRSLGGNFVVVVVLENGSVSEAAKMGEMLLLAAQTSALP
jgi:cell division protein FtsW (lipid II flippase)